MFKNRTVCLAVVSIVTAGIISGITVGKFFRIVMIMLLFYQENIP